MWATYIDVHDIWTENLYGVGSYGWGGLLIIRFFSFTLAGFVGALVAPMRARSTLVALIIASSLVTVFDQFPLSLAHSIWWLALWSLCAPVCTFIGVTIEWWYERQG